MRRLIPTALAHRVVAWMMAMTLVFAAFTMFSALVTQ